MSSLKVTFSLPITIFTITKNEWSVVQPAVEKTDPTQINSRIESQTKHKFQMRVVVKLQWNLATIGFVRTHRHHLLITSYIRCLIAFYSVKLLKFWSWKAKIIVLWEQNISIKTIARELGVAVSNFFVVVLIKTNQTRLYKTPIFICVNFIIHREIQSVDG